MGRGRDELRVKHKKFSAEIIAIVGTSGSIDSACQLLGQLPKNFPLPILYFQPLAERYSQILAQTLMTETDLHVAWVRDGDKLKPGTIYLCPAGFLMVVDEGIVSLIALTKATYGKATSQFVSSFLNGATKNKLLVLLKGIDSTPMHEFLKSFEGSGVLLSEFSARKESSTPSSQYGMQLALPELAFVLNQLCTQNSTSNAPNLSSVLAKGSQAKLKELLMHFLELSLRIHKTKMGNVQLYDEKDRVLRIACQIGFHEEFLRHFWTVGLNDKSTCGRALKTLRSITIEDVAFDPKYNVHRAIAMTAGYRSVQSTPMVSGSGTFYGMISTHSAKPRVFKASEIRVLTHYATIAADALESFTFTVPAQRH